MFDDPEARHQRKRKSWLTMWLVVVTVLFAAGLGLYVTFGPNPPIVVSKETTYLTEPLGPDGLPDYVAALNAHYGDGVTPENNAAVPFLQAMWPSAGADEYELSIADAQRIAEAIGMTDPPAPMTPLDTPERQLAMVMLLREKIRAGVAPPAAKGLSDFSPRTDAEFLAMPDAEAVKDQRIEELRWRLEPVERPFTQTDLPFVVEWLSENRASIDLLIESTNRERWFVPALSEESRDLASGLQSDLSLLQEKRSAARVLQTRSALALGEGRHADAGRDAVAILRLAALVAQGPYLVNQLVAIAIGGVGLAQIDQVAAHPSATAESLRRLLDGAQTAGVSGRLAESMQYGERYFNLSSVIDIAASKGRSGWWEPSLVDDEKSDFVFAGMSVDWNPSLRELNRYYNDFDKVLRLLTPRNRLDAARLLDDEYGVEQFDPRDWRALTPTGRGAILAPSVADLLLSVAELLVRPEERVKLRRLLTKTGVALAIHRAENGAYPETLEELVPGVLDAVPADPFGSGLLVYRRTPGGFLLYSVGYNGGDDGGSLSEANLGWGQPTYEGVLPLPTNEIEAAYDPDDPTQPAPPALMAEIPAGADDVSLRLPLPVEPWPWER